MTRVEGVFINKGPVWLEFLQIRKLVANTALTLNTGHILTYNTGRVHYSHNAEDIKECKSYAGLRLAGLAGMSV